MTPSDERHLHPSSLLFSLGTGAGRFIFPVLLLLFAAKGGQGSLWWSYFIIPSALASVLRYLTYRYQFMPDELVIRSGLLFRNERHIPYERIHNIGLVRNVVHRMLGVSDVRIETAGGQEPEASIQVLGMDAVEEMRRRVFRERREVSAPAEESGPTTLLAMSPWDLALFGIVDNRGGVVIGAAIGLMWEVGWQFGLFGEKGFAPTAVIRPFVTQSIESLPGWGLLVAGAASIVALVALLRLFSMGWAFVNLFGFRLALAGHDLSTTRGLFTRVTASIPLHRIQVVVIRERPLHRLLGCVEVKVETAGSRPEQEKQAGQEWLAPLLPKQDLARLLAVIQPGLALDALPWEPVDPRAGRRILKKEIILATLVTLALVYLIRWLALPLFLVLVVLGVLQSRHQPKHMAYAAPGTFVAWRSGWLWRKLSIARVSKIQAVRVAQSPFDRRYAMARVEVDTAGAKSSGHRIRIPFLDAALAREFAAGLATRAEATQFRW